MKEKQSIILAMCGLTIVLLSFFWWRETHDAAIPIANEETAPPEAAMHVRMPQVSNVTHDTSEWARRLAARGITNDLDSTTKTFKESGNCLYYFIARSVADKNHADNGLTPERNLLWQSTLQQTEALCRGANEETVARAFMVSVLEAAKQGDADAQSCFVILGDDFPSANHEMSARYRKYLQARYIEHGPAVIKNALERGDPYVANMLIYRHFPAGFVADNPRTEEMIPPPDPYLNFRAEQLALYRTPSGSPSHADIETSLNRFLELEILPDDEIVRAEEWAKATYAREFANAPPIDPSKKTPCHSIEGDAP